MKKLFTLFSLIISFTFYAQNSTRSNSSHPLTRYPTKKKNGGTHHTWKRKKQHFNKKDRGISYHRRKERTSGRLHLMKSIFNPDFFYDEDEKHFLLGFGRDDLGFDFPLKQTMPNMEAYIGRYFFLGIKPWSGVPLWFTCSANLGGYGYKTEEGKYNNSDGNVYNSHLKYSSYYTKFLGGIRLEKPGRISPYLSFEAGQIRFGSDVDVYKAKPDGHISADKKDHLSWAQVQQRNSYIWQAGAGVLFNCTDNIYFDVHLSYMGGPATTYMNLDKIKNYSASVNDPSLTVITPPNMQQQKVAETYKTKVSMLSLNFSLGFWF